ALTIGIEIAHLAFFADVADCCELLALIGELSSNDVAVADVFAIQILFFIQDAEGVSRARVQNEVDYTAEDVRHVHDGNSRNLCALTRHKKAVYNIAFLEGGDDVGGTGDGLDGIV